MAFGPDAALKARGLLRALAVALAARGRASGGALFGFGALGGHLLGHGEAATQRQRGSDPAAKARLPSCRDPVCRGLFSFFSGR